MNRSRSTVTLRRLLVALLSALLAVGVLPTAPASADDTGSLSGKVTDVRGASLGGIRVEAFRYDASGERIRERRTRTDPYGSYQLDYLPAGRYYLRFTDPAADYVTGFSSGAAAPASPTSSGTTAVGTGPASAGTSRLAAQGTSTMLAGYLMVRDDYGDPDVPVEQRPTYPVRNNVFLEARKVGADPSSTPAASAITYGGEYELVLPSAGEYVVTVLRSRDRGTAMTTFRATAIAGQRVVQAPFVLSYTEGSGQLSGRVVGAGGAPAADVEVRLIELLDDGESEERDYATTDEAGQYTFSGIVAGDRYTVSAQDDTTERVYLGNTTDLTKARVVTGTTGPQAAPDLRFVRSPGVSISGRVTLPPGASMDNVYIMVERQYSYGFDGWEGFNPEPDGTYEVTKPPGTYRVAVYYSGNGNDPAEPVRSRYAGAGSDVPEKPGDPGYLVLKAGTPLTGQDVTLPAASLLKGTLKDSTGTVDEGRVQLYRWDTGTKAFRYLGSSYVEPDHDEETGDPIPGTGGYQELLDGAGTYTLYFDLGRTKSAGTSQWLGGGASEPTAPTAANSFTVGATPQTVTRTDTLADGVDLGGLVSVGGVPVEGATVTTYVQERDYLRRAAKAFTDADGRWTLRATKGQALTWSVRAPGLQTTWYGGGTTAPETLTASNSLTPQASRTDLDMAMTPRTGPLGTVAGQRLPFCFASGFASRRTSSAVVDFPVRFGGTDYPQLVVGMDGALSFGDVASDDDHPALGSDALPPIIAPLFGEAQKTRGPSSVTYGVSPDGQQFCATWQKMRGVDFRSDVRGTNTFQVILTRADAEEGRTTGDVDVRFNYDAVSWDRMVAGESVPAKVVGLQAGYSTSDGTTTVTLPGSGKPDAFLDTAPGALTRGSLGSVVPGRYNLRVLNGGVQTTRGSAAGKVTADGQGLARAVVQLCRTGGSSCATSRTAGDGTYRFDGLAAGDYLLEVWPDSGDYSLDTVPTVKVAAGTTTTTDVAMKGPDRLPAGGSVTTGGQTTSSGVPTVFIGTPITVTVPPPAGGATPTKAVIVYPDGTKSGTVDVVLKDGKLVATGLTPTQGGQAEIRLLDGNGNVVTKFDVYIDPSGVVTDQYGRPVAGASATLLRSETADGTYAAVPDGSSIMAPGNRTNPDTTTSEGRFAWDVLEGYYKVRSSSAACAAGETPGMSVPPVRLDLLLKLTCTSAGPAPTTAPKVTGDPKLGQVLSVSTGEWAAPLKPTKREWLRDGKPIAGATGATYTVVQDDLGHDLSVRETAQRPAYTQENGSGSTVTFAEATASSNTVKPLAVAPRSTGNPTISGTPAVGSALTATNGTWDQGDLTYRYQWTRNGTAITGATQGSYTPVVADAGSTVGVTVTAVNRSGLTTPASAAAVTVAKVATTTTTTVTLVPGQKKGRKRLPTTFTVGIAVSAPGTTVSGPAKVLVDGKARPATVTVTDGKATVSIGRLKKGRHSVQTQFAGTTQLAASSSAVVIVTAPRR